MPTIDAMLAEGAPPVIAILRGVTKVEAVTIAGALIESGVRIIEVPLNSPEPFASIAAIQATYGKCALIGAGTVLNIDGVDELAATGARVVVMPNTDRAVITRGLDHGLEVLPGFVTPSEAFSALHAGARRLKLFPAGLLGPGYLKALIEVLPRPARIWAVGGVDAANASHWLSAGAEGIAVGGAVYRPGDSPAEVAQKAAALIAAIGEARQTHAPGAMTSR